MAKKKRKLEELGKGGVGGAGAGGGEEQQGAIKKLKLEMPSQNQDAAVMGDPEKGVGDKEEEDSMGVGMMSPESM